MKLDYNDILSQFKDGEKRFLESAMFNKVIRLLMQGANSLSVIDDLLIQLEDIHNKYKEHLRNQYPNIVIESKFNKKINKAVLKHQLNDDLNEYINNLGPQLTLEDFAKLKNGIGFYVNNKYK
jgi:hypothetical protein